MFLDLKKAFDTVNHQILLAKLEKYGIRGLPLQLLACYLNNRLKFAVVNNTKSKFNHVTCGVRQGSTLGPLLFLIYINDMPLVSNLKTKLFADDTVLTLTNSCPRLLNKNFNFELVKIDEWLKLNKLSLNTNKTKFMVLTKQRSARHFDIRIGKTNIEQVNEIKYLGVIFNDKLSRKSHIQHVCSKLSSGSWALLKLRNYVDTTTLKIVYYALIYSYLQYCVSTWGLASTSVLDPLVRIHKCIIRIITNSPFLSHKNPLFQKLNFLKLKDIVKLEMAKTLICFNKSSTKNESQTIISIVQKHHYETRLAAK